MDAALLIEKSVFVLILTAISSKTALVLIVRAHLVYCNLWPMPVNCFSRKN